MSWKSEVPHTHSQIKDRDGSEGPCPGGDHHWIDGGDDEESSVCSRCGEVYVPEFPSP